MVNIRLPDGSQPALSRTGHGRRNRAVDRPRAREGRARRAGRRQARRHVVHGRARRRRRDRHRQGQGRARDHPPLDGAPARLRGEGALPRRAGDDRAGDRERLLLRLLVQAPVHARGSRGDREEDGRAREARHPGQARGVGARRGGRVLQVDRRALQGRDHRGDSRRRADHALPRGRLRRPLPRAARAVHRQAQGLQADEGRRRLLARRLEERDAPAHLRHRVGEEGGPGRVPPHARGGGEARPPPPRHAARSLPRAGRGARHGVLASEGLDDLAAGRAVHAPRLSRQRLPGGARARRSSTAASGRSPGTGRTTRRTCSPRRPRTATTRSSR